MKIIVCLQRRFIQLSSTNVIIDESNMQARNLKGIKYLLKNGRLKE